MKKVFKNLIMVAVLLCVAITFSACSSARTMIKFNEDGTVDELVYVSLNKQEIIKSGQNFLELKTYSETLARQVATKQILNYMQTNNSSAGAITLIDVVWYEEESFQVGLKFASSAVYCNFYGINQQNTVSWQKEKHFLYSKMYQTGSTIYVANSGLYSSIKATVLQNYPAFVDAENELLYTYETSSSREHSNATYVNKINGKYYHTWVIAEENLAMPITIYYNLANRANIFLLCISLSLLVCSVLSIIVFIKQKSTKKARLANK